jgi:nucleoside-diphosphate-sugar epimerase
MKKIIITGSTGFIGSHFLKELSFEYEYELIEMKRSSLNTRNELESQKFPDVDCVVHCAFSRNSNVENLKMINFLYELLLKSRSKDKKLIVLGSFAKYDNNSVIINELSADSLLNLKYVSLKRNVSKELVRLSSTDSSINIIEIDPTIVMGCGGGWQRLANKISSSNGCLRIPFSGKGVCNVIDVNDVIFYIRKLIDIDSNLLNSQGYNKYLINGAFALTWRDWMLKYARVSEENIKTSNDNEWHYNWLINALINFYARLNIFGLFDIKSWDLTSDAVYEPRGLDRYAMRCKGFVDSSEIKKLLGLL